MVINTEKESMYISISKDGTMLNSKEEIPGNTTHVSFKYSFVSLSKNPSPMIIEAFYKNKTAYINGIKIHIVKLTPSQFEYMILVLSTDIKSIL